MMSGYLDTRRLGQQNSKEFRDYLESLAPDAELQAEQEGKQEPDAGKPGDPLESRSRDKRTSSLDTTDINFGLKSPALERRYLELKAINSVRLPNATMDLLRTVLECALKQYLQETGDPIPRDGNRPITLHNALNHAHKHFSQDRTLTQIIAMLRKDKPLNEDQFAKSAQALNAVNHNPDVFFNTTQVRETWDHVRPLIKVLLGGVQAAQGKS